MTAVPSPRELGWEPDQSKHGQHCGIQGSHSLGYGKRGQCTCGRDALVARCEQAERERDEARNTNSALNRRATQAEAVVMQTVEDCRRQGVSIGRALANVSSNSYAARVAELEAALAEIDRIVSLIETVAATGDVGTEEYEAITDATRRISALASPPDGEKP